MLSIRKSSLLHRFQLDHPGVTLHQMEDNMANLMTALSEAELDIASSACRARAVKPLICGLSMRADGYRAAAR